MHYFLFLTSNSYFFFMNIHFYEHLFFSLYYYIIWARRFTLFGERHWFYLRFYLRFSVRFLLAAPMRAETPTNWRKSEKNCRTLMSGMLPSNPPYLLLISLSSKDQCILVPKKKFLSQKIALFYLYILRYLSSTINFGFPS